MSKNTNRKGLALGAVFSLVASLFGAAPASATVSSAAFTIVPAGADTSTFATFVDDDFTLIVNRNPSVFTAADFNSGRIKYAITDTMTWNSTYSITVKVEAATNTAVSALAANDEVSGQTIHYQTTATSATQLSGATSKIPATAAAAVASDAGNGSPWWSTMSFVVNPPAINNSDSHKVTLRLSDANMGTFSPSVNVTVTAFYDSNNDNVFSPALESHAAVTVAFQRYSAVTPSLTVRAVEAGGAFATASATISGINLDQLNANARFAIVFTQWSGAAQVTQTSYSARAEQVVTRALGSSLSDSVTLFSAATAGNTLSAQIVYVSSSATIFSGATETAAQTRWPRVTVTIDSVTALATAQTLHAVKGANALANGFFRPNSLITVRYTASQAVSSAQVPVRFTFNNPTLSTTKTISVDGGAAVTLNTVSALVKTTNTSGVTTFTILTSGFTAGEQITVSAKVDGLAATTITLTAQSPTYTVTPDSTTVATTPGGAVSLGYDVEDQYGEPVAGSDLRLKLEWTRGYNGASTLSYTSAIAGGRATATVNHAPATFTGSARVVATLQTFSTANNLWSDGTATATTDIVVTNTANSFRQGLLATYSASISYAADFTWSATINRAFVAVTGSTVVASGTGLIFKDVVTGLTASNTITLQSNADANVQFQVTGRMAGEYRVTLTAGSSSTSSLITIDDAAATAGKNIAFDLSSITSGRAAIVTGTLTDANGNPVETSGDASVQLTVTGTGAAFVGSLATETTAAGKFSVALLSGAGDLGTVTITATYFPTAGAAAADRVTKVHTVSVVAAAAPEVNAVIGSFSGRWAVRVENAKGSVVSVKAGNRWVKFSALNNNYLYSMRSVKGRTIAVSVWVDGELQNSQTITIK